jgi:hypothetical protein
VRAAAAKRLLLAVGLGMARRRRILSHVTGRLRLLPLMAGRSRILALVTRRRRVLALMTRRCGLLALMTGRRRLLTLRESDPGRDQQSKRGGGDEFSKHIVLLVC